MRLSGLGMPNMEAVSSVLDDASISAPGRDRLYFMKSCLRAGGFAASVRAYQLS